MQLINKNIAPMLSSPKEAKVVQIRTGIADDAFYYLAEIVYNKNLNFHVLFHEGSVLLDKIRLFGSCEVLADFPSGESFSANLELLDNLGLLSLKLKNILKTEKHKEEQVYFNT